MTEEKTINEDNNQNNNNINDNMAVKFPEWDLLPPDLLLKRGKNENT